MCTIICNTTTHLLFTIDWIPGSEVPTEIYWLYMFQMGLYVHSIYTTIFVDEIRKDFVVMLLHHFLTLGLLSYSIGVGYVIIILLAKISILIINASQQCYVH